VSETTTQRPQRPRDRPRSEQEHPEQPRRPAPDHDPAAGFEHLYRSHIDAVTAYFARRSTDPQTVADLTADTFVEAITSYTTFDARRGTPRAWVFGIARRVFAEHCQAHARHRERTVRLAGRRELSADHVEELLDRIDAERLGRHLVSELTRLPDLDRQCVELVDLAGLKAKEAAKVLGISQGAVRMRLMRARARLRRAHETRPEAEQNHE
jgi:RNA polymerase sigma-70 factor (ECF subfamily)